jgi:phosphoribosylformylglycinamidine synthase II
VKRYLLEVGYRPGVNDPRGRRTAREIREFLGIDIGGVETRNIYGLEVEMSAAEAERAARELFADPVIQEFSFSGSLAAESCDYSVLVSYKPGVTDNVGRTAAEALGNLLGRPLTGDEGVSTAVQYLLTKASRRDAERIAAELLANPLIENSLIQDAAAWRRDGLTLPPARLRESSHRPTVERISLETPDPELLALSRRRTLALNLAELRAIRDYFRQPRVRAERAALKLGADPTDVELEVLAQTWSEHCHHKVFNGVIRYTDPEGAAVTIRSLFKTYIRRVTEKIDADWLLSVFTDNAGVIRFNESKALVYKVETHNSPSALDPYGGAMTGIVGVNRDPFGTGLGARLIANVWGYCLGNPFYDRPLPEGLLHPHRIREGVHRGVIEGGNQSGIPMLRGWELFEDRFMGKPLVFCGTLGEMPLEIQGRSTAAKEVRPGDLVLMLGGRVGKDGIHGATFSSEELHAESPVQAVQIGDPITQKRMTDMLLEARDRLLYRAITDNGAGGLSSSVGEMALLAGGCEIDLARVPLKYPGLDPWEILVSEAQERMTLAVPPEDLDAFLELAARRGVEATVLGRFTGSGRFRVRYREEPVACLDLDFLHHGDPDYELEARFEVKSFEEPDIDIPDAGSFFLGMLARLNIRSGEEKVRQYDHEVQGRSVIKPCVGRCGDVPGDAGVLLAEYGEREGIVLSEAVNPFYSDLDTYHMARAVVDLAVRRVTAAGGDPAYIAGLDNFCWPNVVKEEMPERSHKLAQLVRANQGLYDACLAYRVPLISGKDSMSNDCTLTSPPISVPPTLLVSVISRIDDVELALTLDVKQAGDLIYVLGETHPELGGSEFLRAYGEMTRGAGYVGGGVPVLDAELSRRLCERLHRAACRRLLRSAHAVALGGLAVGLARKTMAGRLGAEIDLKAVPGTAADDTTLLYSESTGRLLVTVSPEQRREFEGLTGGLPCALIGRVTAAGRLRFTGTGGGGIIDVSLDEMLASWKNRLREAGA